MIRLALPLIEKDDLKAVSNTIASGYLVQGKTVESFEQTVADYVGTKYAVTVSSCTAALHLSLLAIDIAPGDLILVTSYSWIATANVIELCGAQPVFVDICPDTFNMDIECLETELKRLMRVKHTAKRVKAILPVHTFGHLANMPEILEIASRYDLYVIEDAACALGASFFEQQAGTWGVMGCFSFHPRKTITTGEGGIITTNDFILANKLRELRNHGLDPCASSPDFIMPGYNYRMTEFQAALGISQMTKLNHIIDTKCKLAKNYNELLEDTVFKSPYVLYGNKHVYQSYVVLLPDALADERELLIAKLKEKGIETTIGTLNMPMTSYYRSRYAYKSADFPVSNWIFNHSLTLPLYPTMTKEEQFETIKSLTNLEYTDRK